MYRIMHEYLLVSPFMQQHEKYRFEETYFLMSKQLVIFLEK